MSVINVDPVTALVLDRLDRFEKAMKDDLKEHKSDFERALAEQNARVKKIEDSQHAHNATMNAFVNKWKGGAMALAGIGSVLSYATGVLDPLIKYFSTRQ
jgi:predicted acetyltransferase